VKTPDPSEISTAGSQPGQITDDPGLVEAPIEGSSILDELLERLGPYRKGIVAAGAAAALVIDAATDPTPQTIIAAGVAVVAAVLVYFLPNSQSNEF